MINNPVPEKLAHVAARLEQNNMQVIYAEDRMAARAAVEKLLQPGASIGLGGSATLQECGIMELVRRPEYRLIDRTRPGLTPVQLEEKFAEALTADVFLCSTNAITEDGMLYNVDGTSNRVAALVYGPKKVIVVAGVNKIVPDLAAAVERVRTVAAPRNAQRLNKNTYCAAHGVCKSCGQPMGAGCGSPQRICRNFVVSTAQAKKDRICVILVNEALGY
ncbi:MAG: lactate utilization protein [Clostridia bacterium]|nr:lactate utilization protein [Clostridia bacterium]